MEVIRNIIYMLGGLIAISFTIFSGDMPGVLLDYRLPIVGGYLVVLAIVEYARSKRSR